MRTKLGWVLSGPVDTSEQLSSSAILLLIPYEWIHFRMIQTTWMTHFILGIGVIWSFELVYEIFEQTVCCRVGRYEVVLPWNDLYPLLPDNYHFSAKKFGV